MNVSKNNLVVVMVAVLVLSLSTASRATLVAHWTFDEVSGQDVFDSTANNNDGVLGTSSAVQAASDPLRVAGHIGTGALQFDALNDSVAVPDSASISVTGDLTLSAWINVSLPDNGLARNILAKASNGSYRWRINGSGPQWLLLEDGGGLEIETGSDISSTFGAWHLASVVYDASAGTVRFYQDGVFDVQQTTGALSIVDSTGALALGANSAGGAESFDGLLDDIGIYSRSLSDTDIMAVFSLADEAALVYDLSDAEQLFNLTGGDTVDIDGRTWRVDNSLTGPEGTLVPSDGEFSLNLGSGIGVTSLPIPVPEPSTLLLLGLGMLGLVRHTQRRRRKA